MYYMRVSSGKGYNIYEEKFGAIQRLDIPSTPSRAWGMQGVVDRYNRFMKLGEFIKKVDAGLELRYKNGKGKYYPVDLDYSTVRVWSERIIYFGRS